MLRLDLHPLRLLHGVVVAGGVVDLQFFLPFPDGVRQGDGGQKRPGVGVQGMGEELFRLGKLHNDPLVNDGDAVGDKAHHRKVVGYKEIGEVPLLLEPGQEV